MLTTRSSGILLHIASLPSSPWIGDLGPAAYHFVDFLAEAGQREWQVLPVNPTGQRNSPYDALSAMAGNPLLVSPERLAEARMLTPRDLRNVPAAGGDRIDHRAARKRKQRLLDAAWSRAGRELRDDPAFEQFRSEHHAWLEDVALFMALRRAAPRAGWRAWPAGIRNRRAADLRRCRKELRHDVQREEFVQYVFYKQWFDLKDYANRRGIRMVGDMPFYVAMDSADVWAEPTLFKLTRDREPRAVAGVPPDRFSASGQLWGNPVYDWDRQAKDGYAWWLRRLGHTFRMFDLVRIDHFRGFAACWETPAGNRTAAGGQWVPAPGRDILREVYRRFPFAPLIAEDLGTITPDVRELMREFQLPGMAVLQFAFESDTGDNAYAPHHHTPNGVVYPGTHDNNTTRGWFVKEADRSTRKRLCEYAGRRITAASAAETFLRMAMSSVCRLSVVTMQDVLGLGPEARMNDPSTSTGNWQWRLKPGQASPSLAARLRAMTIRYGRG